MEAIKINLNKYDVVFKKDENDIEISVNRDGIYYKGYLSDFEIWELIKLLQSVPITQNI